MFPCVLRACSVCFHIWPDHLPLTRQQKLAWPHKEEQFLITVVIVITGIAIVIVIIVVNSKLLCFWAKWLLLHLKNQFSYQLTGLIANSKTASHLISRLIHRFCNSSTFRKVDRHVSHIYRVTMTTHSYNGPFWKKKFTLTKNLQSVSQEKYDAKKEQGKRTCK